MNKLLFNRTEKAEFVSMISVLQEYEVQFEVSREGEQYAITFTPRK